MRGGWNNQVVRQIGEHLVTAELGRRKYAAAPFAGNVPDWDVVAADQSGCVLPIQVKTINPGSSWQFDVRRYLEVEILATEQIIHGVVPLAHPNLMCIYVALQHPPPDEFFIFKMSDYQLLVHRQYVPRKVPYKVSSCHCAFRPRDLAQFKNQWETLEAAFAQAHAAQAISK